MKKPIWEVFHSTELSDEQKECFLPPRYSYINSIIMVCIDIDEENCDWIIIGEITPINIQQAEIICKALNDSNVPPNSHKEHI